ncbi:MAG: STAS domain-containing protein [Streptosporangiaceae bacterium]|nr:STAS domain-containing protein [Streptosporangiaceae bacterium]
MTIRGNGEHQEGDIVIVTLPAEIDVTNADEIREQLLSAANQGASVLVADMTQTTFCDSSGITALVRGFRRANENGTKFRLATTSPAVLRVLEITGVDRLIDVYSTIAEALGSPNSDGGSSNGAGS